MLVFTDDVKNTKNSSQGLPLVILYAALIAEEIFYSPLATLRKRGAQHLLMWKSGSTIFTWLSPLCYSVIYVRIVIMGVVFSLWFLVYLSKYLNMPRKVTYSLQSIEWFLGIQYDMTSRTTHFAVGYLATVLFFYLQDYISRGHVMSIVNL